MNYNHEENIYRGDEEDIPRLHYGEIEILVSRLHYGEIEILV